MVRGRAAAGLQWRPPADGEGRTKVQSPTQTKRCQSPCSVSHTIAREPMPWLNTADVPSQQQQCLERAVGGPNES
jgi:hypothetical protein